MSDLDTQLGGADPVALAAGYRREHAYATARGKKDVAKAIEKELDRIGASLNPAAEPRPRTATPRKAAPKKATPPAPQTPTPPAPGED